ncbi:LysE family translocator [Streptomyces lanatus]|uniref:LysE family translocator n=1 Tax=Streptomyces lanatus TaxID=66900 RepID=A0ABV1Y6N4_9ACTN|nr:LysE family translocator [Streptomyces lanatus]GHH12110.1 lysine transporter LysE [Streptomyces lanatus]
MDASLIAFTGVSAGLVAMPGADFTVVVRNALVSRRAGIACALGIGAGLLIHVTLAVAGVAAVLAAVPALLRALQMVGGAYVLYLGVQTLRQRDNEVVDAGEGSTARPLRQGFVTNALNPKVSLTFLSVLPQFVPAGSAALPRTLLLALIVLAIALVWFQAVALLVDRLGNWLRRPRAARAVTVGTGLALTAFGVALLAGPLTAL